MRTIACTFLVAAAGCAGDAAMMSDRMPADPGDTPYMLTTGDFPVAAGTEKTQCMYVPAPADGEIAIHRVEAHMPEGSHHFNLFYLAQPPDPPVAGLRDCTELFRIWLAGSQWTTLDYSLPAGKAIKIPKGSWLALESHFVNATTTEKMARVDVTLHTMPAAAVVDWVGVYFNVMQKIQVAPSTKATLTARCPAHPGTQVFLLTSHMHHFGDEFDINLYDDAAGTTTPMYASTDWSHPLVQSNNPPLTVGSDQGFEWKCRYDNDRPSTLWGGDSAGDNEMCIMTALYWPAVAGAPYCFADATSQ